MAYIRPAISCGDVALGVDSHDYIQYMKHWDLGPSFFEMEAKINNENTRLLLCNLVKYSCKPSSCGCLRHYNIRYNTLYTCQRNAHAKK